MGGLTYRLLDFNVARSISHHGLSDLSLLLDDLIGGHFEERRVDG
jgi:hypothetical protein